MDRVIQFSTDEGQMVYVEVGQPITRAEAVDAADDDGFLVKASRRFEEGLGTVKIVSKKVLDKVLEVREPRPTQVEVEFGLTLKADLGAVIAKAGTESNFRVKLTWADLKQPEHGRSQKGREQGNQHVGDDHHPAAAPAVHERPGERGQDNRGRYGDQRGRGQDGGRAGALGEPPDEGKAYQGTAHHRARLADPDGKETHLPRGSGHPTPLGNLPEPQRSL